MNPKLKRYGMSIYNKTIEILNYHYKIRLICCNINCSNLFNLLTNPRGKLEFLHVKDVSSFYEIRDIFGPIFEQLEYREEKNSIFIIIAR